MAISAKELVDNHKALTKVQALLKERWNIDYDPVAGTVTIPLSESISLTAHVNVTISGAE
jgi:hypothetical protein